MLLVVLARSQARERAVAWLAVTSSGAVLATLAAATGALGRVDDVGPERVATTVAGAAIGLAVTVQLTRRLGLLWSLAALVGGAVAAALVPADVRSLWHYNADC